MAGKFNLTARILFKVNCCAKTHDINLVRFDKNMVNLVIILYIKVNAKSSLLCLKAIDSILDNHVIDTDQSEFSNLLMEVSRNRVEKHFVEMQKDSDFGLESKWKCNEDILSPIILGSFSYWSANQRPETLDQ